VDVHNGGGGAKANVDACGQGEGSQILLKLCGHHKQMPPYHKFKVLAAIAAVRILILAAYNTHCRDAIHSDIIRVVD